MSVALRVQVGASETFHPEKGRLLHEGQIPPQVHTLVLKMIMFYFYFPKATFPVCAQFNVSPSTSETWFSHERIAGMPE